MVTRAASVFLAWALPVGSYIAALVAVLAPSWWSLRPGVMLVLFGSRLLDPLPLWSNSFPDDWSACFPNVSVFIYNWWSISLDRAPEVFCWAAAGRAPSFGAVFLCWAAFGSDKTVVLEAAAARREESFYDLSNSYFECLSLINWITCR